MTPSDLDALDPGAVADLLGLARTKGPLAHVTPCPACGAERAHGGREERRGPVHIRSGWACWACGVKGSRCDLAARVRTGRPWAALDGRERRDVLDSLGGATAAPVASWTPPPARYLDGETWAAIMGASVPASMSRSCRAWAARRGLRLARSLLALPSSPVDGLPLVDGEGRWLPAMGYELGLPMCDGTGRIVAMRLRNTRPDARLKEVALPGYSSIGCVYAPWRVREAWMAGAPCPRPVVLVEGGPDWLAAGGAWHRDRDVIGYVSGSMTGAPWARWLAQLHPDTILIPQVDRARRDGRTPAGQRYAQQIREAAPWVRMWPMEQVYSAAGRAWVLGRDLADLRDLPPLSAAA